MRNRIPREFFVTSGVGESDITVHAGSYHLALRDAGIEAANIMTYSSILPARAAEVPRSSYVITHGEVMETICAVATATYGSTATAGLTWGWLYDRTTRERVGGLVAEYSGNLLGDAAKLHLGEMLNELYENGYGHLVLRDRTTVVRTVSPVKMYGTAVVALCFVSHEWPTKEA